MCTVLLVVTVTLDVRCGGDEGMAQVRPISLVGDLLLLLEMAVAEPHGALLGRQICLLPCNVLRVC